MEIKTRKQAALDGESKYWTGRQCSKGHDSPRYVASGVCCKCNAEAQKAYTSGMRKMSNARLQGHFTYKLHPDDMAAALAYCQALDLQRGRVPESPAAPRPELPFALPEHIARHRQQLIDANAPREAPYIPAP